MTINELEFPENIMFDIFKERANKIDKEIFVKNYDYIVKKIFTEKERNILDRKYKEHKDFRELSDEFGFSYEWIRNINIKMINKLSRPVISLFLETGNKPNTTPVEFLKIDFRCYNGLISNGLDYVEDVIEIDYDKFCSLPKISFKIANVIINAVEELGFDTTYLRKSKKSDLNVKRFMRTHKLTKDEMIEYVKSL